MTGALARRSRLPTVEIVIAVAGLIAVLAFAAYLSRPKPLLDANTACGGIGQVTDGGHTLQLRADDMAFGACVLRQLDAPPAVLVHFGNTGPGTQVDGWGGYAVTWTADPAGLAMTVRG